MRRVKQTEARNCSHKNSESLKSPSDESFRIDSIVGKSDSSSHGVSSAGGKNSFSSTSPSTSGKSNGLSMTTPSTEIGSLSKKKKKKLPIVAVATNPERQPSRPLWLTAFYIMVTVGSLFGIFFDGGSDSRRNTRSNSRNQYMIPSPDEFASLRRDPRNGTVLAKILPAPTNQYHLFHVAPVSNLGNNLLNNILMGMFDGPDAFVSQVFYDAATGGFRTLHREQTASCTVTIVSQTNETDISAVEKKFGVLFQRIFFVALKSPKIPDCLTPPENMICFDYNDMAYENKQGRAIVVERVRQRLQSDFPYFSKIEFDMNRVFLRLDGMEKMIAELLDRPLSDVDPQYGIHGQQPLTKDPKRER